MTTSNRARMARTNVAMRRRAERPTPTAFDIANLDPFQFCGDRAGWAESSAPFRMVADSLRQPFPEDTLSRLYFQSRLAGALTLRAAGEIRHKRTSPALGGGTRHSAKLCRAMEDLLEAGRSIARILGELQELVDGVSGEEE